MLGAETHIFTVLATIVIPEPGLCNILFRVNIVQLTYQNKMTLNIIIGGISLNFIHFLTKSSDIYNTKFLYMGLLTKFSDIKYKYCSI